MFPFRTFYATYLKENTPIQFILIQIIKGKAIPVTGREGP
jgi:hypothetical protein